MPDFQYELTSRAALERAIAQNEAHLLKILVLERDLEASHREIARLKILAGETTSIVSI